MKVHILFLLIPVFFLASVASAQETATQKFKKLNWLSGKWNRANAKQGESGYETWSKMADNKLVGKGVTLKGKETIFVENLEFIIKDNEIYYTVMIPTDKKPVYFKLTALTNKSFTCENAQHDFPKKITYTKKGNNVKAVISGGGQSIDYDFVKTGLK
ncbi:DUF6265 family protein [Pedobacter sp. Leaf176]|uniref:DUF6265 family protein n=1 Tax=Pedobacter sp. Leaf176 TaxID=1736286 RepID=UPI0006FA24B1|nr:DUF6265 family protein [Pedobacter sp. Leaf176]KQR67719.1 hypothetical protein ASF92_18790 [Pedobacter sp. Leaf176]